MADQGPSAGAAAAGCTVTLPPVLREFCLVSLALTLISVLYCATQLLLFHRGNPYSWPFFIPEARFTDFTIYQEKFRLLGEPDFWTTGYPFTYPAPMGVLYEAFFRVLGRQALHAFLAFMLLAVAAPAAFFWRALRIRGLSAWTASGFAAACLLLSWPVALLLDRGNVEIFVWVALVLGTWGYARGREWAASTCFGVAAGLKLFPFVFLVLFLTRKKFPKLVAAAAIFGLVTLASLAIMGPTVNAANHGVEDGLSFFQQNYMGQYRPAEQGFDHSIFGFIKTFVAVALRHPSTKAPHVMLKAYLPLSAVMGALLYFLIIRRLPWRNQLLALSIVSIYFTAFSGDGTLVHLYYGFALCCFVAIDAWRRKLEIPGLRAMFLCFAFLFSTESFFVATGQRFEGQAKGIALGILLVCALRYPLGQPVESAEQELPGLPDASRIATAKTLAAQAETSLVWVR